MVQIRVVGMVFCVAVSLAALKLVFPGVMDPHFVEDRTIEVLSALTFLGAALLTIRAVRPLSGLQRGGVLAVGLVCFLAFLDEMSFGQRVFGLEAPEILGVEFDAIHDVTSVIQVAVGSEIALALLLLLCGVGLFAVKRLRQHQGGVRSERQGVPWVLVYFAILSVAAAQILDMYIGPLRHPVVKASGAEELLEFSAALLLLGFMLQVIRMPTQRIG